MNETTVLRTLRERLLAVEERLDAACRRAGRARSDVTLVAVTKSISTELAALLPELGVLDLGESRPQELWHKSENLGPRVRWHMIGHLQSNKIERTLPIAHCIHAVDSIRLLHAIDAEAARQHLSPAILLQVNTSGETSKHGFAPEEVPDLADEVAKTRHAQVQGLMTMAALQEPEACRAGFALLRRLRDELQGRVSATHNLRHLSMGMSNDYEVAVEEGATFVRLGTVLFEGLEK